MRPNLFEITYFETYYFANIIKSILSNPFEYLRTLDEFFGDENYMGFVHPFPKPSLFHRFIKWTIHQVSYEDMSKVNIDDIRMGRKLWVDIAMEHFKMEGSSFGLFLEEKNKKLSTADDDDIYDYFQDLALYEVYDDLLDKMSEEIFFILFLNRRLLQEFNGFMAFYISGHKQGMHIIGADDVDQYFKKDGVLRRVHIPSWVKKAVFFRDRGRCAHCHKDVSGYLNISNAENYDHVIPLDQGGANDVTNIQLLCDKCNKSKGKKLQSTSSFYERWF